MVSLSKDFMAVCLNDKDFCDLLDSSLCALKYDWWLAFWVWCWTCLSVTQSLLHNDILMKWNGNTMLWLGERCSSYELDKSLCVWCIKEWVNGGSTCLSCIEWKMVRSLYSLQFWFIEFYVIMFECCELLYSSLSPC